MAKQQSLTLNTSTAGTTTSWAGFRVLAPRSAGREKRKGGLMFSLTPEVGIDLGTANILIYVRGEGIVLREPSVVAIASASKKVLAVGEEARLMIGRTPGNIVSIRPMSDGVIADYTTTQKMLEYLFAKEVVRKRLLK